MLKVFAGASPLHPMTWRKKLPSTTRIYPGIRAIVVIFNFTTEFLIILHAAFEQFIIWDSYWATSSTKFVQQMLFCFPDSLPVATVVLSYLKTNFFAIFRTSSKLMRLS